ncbi:MAG TPA: hypothetical protein VFQ53_42810 [Kofleriaceae bacterium]|nr:hypothetical protein [Kofleriaceae bacterium]
MAIEQARFGGAACRLCGGSISRATYRYLEPLPPQFRGDRLKHEHYHLLCALQVMPLRLARDLDAFEGTLPHRATIDRVVELWRQAIADPDDDGPRIVLADLLQSLGDPRGELMALQLLPAGGEERIDALVYQHQERWIGRHRDIALAVQFRRGLLGSLELSDAHHPTQEHDPDLATVEDLLPGSADSTRYRKYAAAMTGLRRLEVWDEDSLAALAETPSKLVHVACSYKTLGIGDGLAELGARFLRACAKHPIRSLALQASAFETVGKSPLVAGVSSLTLAGKLRDVLPIWTTLPRTTTLTITQAARLRSLVELWPGDLELRHTDDGVAAHASGQWLTDGLVGVLPAGVTSLVAEGATEDLKAKLTLAARSRAIAIEFVAAPRRTAIWRHA